MNAFNLCIVIGLFGLANSPDASALPQSLLLSSHLRPSGVMLSSGNLKLDSPVTTSEASDEKISSANMFYIEDESGDNSYFADHNNRVLASLAKIDPQFATIITSTPTTTTTTTTTMATIKTIDDRDNEINTATEDRRDDDQENGSGDDPSISPRRFDESAGNGVSNPFALTTTNEGVMLNESIETTIVPGSASSTTKQEDFNNLNVAPSLNKAPGLSSLQTLTRASLLFALLLYLL